MLIEMQTQHPRALVRQHILVHTGRIRLIAKNGMLMADAHGARLIVVVIHILMKVLVKEIQDVLGMN